MGENWNTLVDDLIPLGVAQLCFFYAEKIRFLAEDETSNQALGEAIKALLGLDLAERLVANRLVLRLGVNGGKKFMGTQPTLTLWRRWIHRAPMPNLRPFAAAFTEAVHLRTLPRPTLPQNLSA